MKASEARDLTSKNQLTIDSCFEKIKNIAENGGDTYGIEPHKHVSQELLNELVEKGYSVRKVHIETYNIYEYRISW